MVLLHLLDVAEEGLVVVGCLHRTGDVSPFIYMPEEQCNMVLVVDEVGHDGRFQEGSDQK